MAKSTRRRTRGEGSLYRTATGRWRGALTLTDAAGRQHRRYVSASTAEEARRKLTELRRSADVGYVASVGARLTVSDFLGRWLEASRIRVRASTWRGHEGNIRRYVVPAVGRLPLVKLSPQDVERMTADMLGRGLSSTTARAARTTLRLALADAVRDGMVPRNVAAIARPPRVVERQPHYLSAEEVHRVLATEAEHAPLFALALSTGLREGELLGLTWDAVDIDAAQLMVRRSMARDWSGGWSLAEPKTSRSRRTIALPARGVEALRRQRVRQTEAKLAAGSAWQDRDGLCFTDELGRPFRGWQVSKAWARALQTAGVHHVPFHAARHTYATLALAAGVPLKVVSENLGHSTITITANVYASVTPDLRRDAASAMDRVLGDAS